MSSPSAQPIKIKPRINALAQYLMVLAAVIGSYSLYAKHAVPWLEGPPHLIKKTPVVALEDLTSPQVDKTHLVPYLPKDAWELSDCKTLLTASGTILFKDFHEQADGTIKVAPFTLFMGLENKFNRTEKNEKDKPKHPTVLRCIEGANLKFDQPMSEVFAGKAKLESARLVGNVDIFRAPSSPKANDALEVLTSNVQLDKQRIFTLDNVQFAFGPNRGTGRNLVIDLAHDSSPLGADFSNVIGVRRLELAFLHQLRFEPPNRENSLDLGTDNSAQSSPAKPKLFSNNKSPIDVSCQGPFVFDFETKMASFEDQVVARQVDPFRDTIECDKLTLEFREKINPIVPQEGEPLDEMGNLELQTFVAQGSPAIVISRSSSAKVSGEFLRYDVLSNRIAGHCNPDNQLMVTMVSPEYQMVTKDLEYILMEDGSLGPIKATGPGRLLKLASKDQKQFFASWKKSLTSSDVAGQTGLQRVVLDGETKIRIGTDTNASANSIELFVWQLPVIKLDKNSNPKQGWDFQPYKIIAEGNVDIDSTKFEGVAESLTAIWSRGGLERSAAGISHQVGYRGTFQIQENQSATYPSNSEQSSRPQNELGATPFRRVNEEPIFAGPLTKTNLAAIDSAPSTDSNSHQLPPNHHGQSPKGFVELATFNEEVQAAEKRKPKAPKKIKFRGQEVVVQLAGSGKETEIRDLTVIGNVFVTDVTTTTTDSKPDQQPFVIQGDRLRLVPQGKEMYRALVSSDAGTDNLASITTRDLKLLGVTVNLDQKSNKLWVEGSGSMKLKKVESDRDRETAQTQILNGQEAFKKLIKQPLPQDLNVSWAGGMIFDGSKIYFEREVVMSAIKPDKDGRTDIKSSSEGLSIELETPVNFQDLSEDSDLGEAKVRSLVFANSIPDSKRAFQLAGHSDQTDSSLTNPRLVVVEIRKFDIGGKLIEKQNVSVPRATVNAQTGALFAKGPGSLATHRMGSTDSSNPLSKLSKSRNKDGLTFIQVNFDGELNINAEQKQMKVDGNVRTIYAPVGSWDKTYDPDRARQFAPPGSVNLSCEHLQLAQWQPRANEKPVSEMIASGNTHLFSESFESTGDRISFNQRTDMLTIEGTSRTDANLWFKQTPNDNSPTHLIHEKIKFRVTDQWVQVQGIKNVKTSGK